MGGQGGKRAWALPPEHQFRAGRGPGVRGDPRPGLSRQRARSPLTLRMETPDQARAGRPLAVGPRGDPEGRQQLLTRHILCVSVRRARGLVHPQSRTLRADA